MIEPIATTVATLEPEIAANMAQAATPASPSPPGKWPTSEVVNAIIRRATPPGSAGRVYGFVYSGLDLGGIIGPVAFGFMLDHGHPQAMLLVVALCYLMAIGTVIQVRTASTRRASIAPEVA